jgi:hypothetical protein
MIPAHQNATRVVEATAHGKPQSGEAVVVLPTHKAPAKILSFQQLKDIFATSDLLNDDEILISEI